MPNETFISYSRRDSEFVSKLVDGLKTAGIDPWIDMEDLKPGVKWNKEILISVQTCHNFVFVISPDAIASPYCTDELNHALMHNKRLIPLMFLDEVEGIPESLAERNWIFFKKKGEPITPKSFSEGMARLIEAIESPSGVSTGDRLDSLIEFRTHGKPSRVFFLYRNNYLVGRSPQGDITKSGIILIADKWVSGLHMKLNLINGRWMVMDISRNGIHVNGTPLKKQTFRPLRHDDIIKISPITTAIYSEIYPGDLVVLPDDKDTATSGEL
ncbi:MAG TPA: TIR domain-containing protein [Cyanophyceae cyanobacterium]